MHHIPVYHLHLSLLFWFGEAGLHAQCEEQIIGKLKVVNSLVGKTSLSEQPKKEVQCGRKKQSSYL